MKKLYETFSAWHCHALILLFFVLASNLTAQTLRFNELSGDSGNNDGSNDGIVELINTGATSFDASCYVVSNGEWVVVLPPNTFIPAGEVFLIACSEGQNLGANPNPVPGSGLTCATCDFPNMPIAFDVCDPANADFVDWAATGFTIDNQADDDGDQIVLFAPDGAIVQAAKWGGGATSGFDNTAVQAGSYTLGTAGTGGFGLSSAELPVALQAGGSCATASVFTMPIITDAVYEDLTLAPNPAGKTINNTVLQGCNSSFIYDATSMTWSKTDHPNPGQFNTVPAYEFSFSAPTVQCADAVQEVLVTLEIYNWQAVTPGITNAKGGVGSFVSFDGGATPIAWDTYNRNDATGITTLTYTFTPTMNQTLSLVWDDDKSSLFASTPTGSSSSISVVNNSTPSDCYTLSQTPVAVVQPLMVSDVNISCPTDFPTGTVNIGALTTGGFNNTFELLDNGISQALNNTGIFTISNTLVGPITVVVTDGSNCSTPIVVNIDNNCRQAPVCPTDLAYDACITPSGSACPSDELNLSITSMGLPAGGQVEWVQVANAADDPYLSGTVVASQTISVVSGAPNGNPTLNEIIVDATTESGSNFGEGWEIAGTPGTDIGCWYFTDGDFVVQIPAGTAIPSDGFYVTGSSSSDATWNANIDLLLTASSTVPNLTNGGEYLGVFNASNNFIEGVTWGSPTTNNAPATTAAPSTAVTGSGCPALPAFATIQSSIQSNAAAFVDAGTANGTNERSIERDMDVNGVWQLSADPGGATHTMGTSNTGTGTPTITLAPSCANFVVPSDACNSTIYIRPRIIPLDASCNNPTLPALSYDIVCPTVIVSGENIVCAPSTGAVTINATNTGGGEVNVMLVRLSDASTYGPFIGMGDGDFIATGLPAGEYQILTASVTGTCIPSTSGTATVQINPVPAISLSGMVQVCPGLIAEIPLTIHAGTFPFQITYNIDGGTDQTIEVFTNQLNIPTAGLTLGNHMVNIVSITDANNCPGTFSGSFNITIPTPPDLAPISDQTNDCPNTTVDLTTLLITDNNNTMGTLSYHTTLVGAQLDNMTDLVPQPNSVGAGTYYIRKQTTEGCYDVENVSITITTCICAAPASVAITETSVAVCGSAIATFNYMVANGPANLSSNGMGILSTNMLPNGTSTFTYTPDINDIGNTVTITAEILDPDGAGACLAASDVATVVVNTLPTAFNITGGGDYCTGGDGIDIGLSDSEIGVNYQLQLSGLAIGTAIPGTGEAISFGNQTQAGTYTVVATNSTTNCMQNMSGSAMIIVHPLPTILLGENPTVCQGVTSVLLPFAATEHNPDQFSIDFSDMLLTDITDQALSDPPGNIVSSIPDDLPGGIYSGILTVHSSTTGCTSAPYAISITVNAVNPGTIGSDQTICITKDPLTFTATAATATGGATISYQWERSFANCNNDFTFLADTELYDISKGELQKTAYFRRRAISILNGVQCESVSNCVTIDVLNVSCGEFPWDGQ